MLTMDQPTFHLPEGTILGNGKYRIVRFIGAGGFGCTYEAEFLMMRTRVAIKEFYVNSMCNRQASGVISLGAMSQANLIQRLEDKFVREAQSLFGLSHPHIVGVKDVFKELGTSYYVMDYIDGRSLQEIVDEEGPMPEGRALHYIKQVMDALEYVHSQRMLHLDIKPNNIMIDKNDNVILIDFGVSKQYDEVGDHNTSTIMGQTPGFAPLEQLTNTVKQFTPATDIYALGATLYALLTGETPVPAADLMAGLTHLKPLPGGVSDNIRKAIGAMMQPKRDYRPQSIAQVRRLLAFEAAPIVPPSVETVVTPQSSNASVQSVKPEAPVKREPSAKPVKSEKPHVPTIPLSDAGGVVPPKPPVGQPDVFASKPSSSHKNATLHISSVDAPKPEGKKPSLKLWIWIGVAVGLVTFFVVGGVILYLGQNKSDKRVVDDAEIYVEDDNALPEDEDRYPAENVELIEEEVVVEEVVDAPSASTASTASATPSAPTSGTSNGHGWVDMGTSVYWATTNVGSSTPKGDGSYFAWAESATKSCYDETTSLYYGNTMSSIAGSGKYDCARINWGGKWRMPTKAECQELISKCTWYWYGSGMKVTARNGNVIYLPAAGFAGTTPNSPLDHEKLGYYWSATPYDNESSWSLTFDSSGARVSSSDDARYWGMTIRPVMDK